MEKTMRLQIGVVLAVLVVAGRVSAGKLPFTVSKGTTGVVEPLKADGSPDYLGAINAEHSRGVTVENNGFVVWVKLCGVKGFVDPTLATQVLAMLGLKASEQGNSRFETYREYAERVDKAADGNPLDEMDELWKKPWKAEEHPRMAAYLKEEGAALEEIVASSAREKWWMPYVSRSGRVVDVMVPRLGKLRAGVNALCVRAALRAGNGDIAGCVEDVIAAKRIGRQVATGHCLIERLVGSAIDIRAGKTLAAMVGTGTWKEGNISAAEKALSSLGPIAPVAGAVDEGERWLGLDLLTTLVMERPTLMNAGNDFFRPFQTVEWEKLDVDRMLRRLNAAYDEEVAIMKTPDIHTIRAKEAPLGKRLVGMETASTAQGGRMLWMRKGEDREAYSDRVLVAFMADFFPTVAKSAELGQRDVLTTEIVEGVLRAAAEKARTGAWPRQVAGLPVDIYARDGAKVRYVVGDAGVRVYSVGENGKDDGGVKNDTGADDIAVGAMGK